MDEAIQRRRTSLETMQARVAELLGGELDGDAVGGDNQVAPPREGRMRELGRLEGRLVQFEAARWPTRCEHLLEVCDAARRASTDAGLGDAGCGAERPVTDGPSVAIADDWRRLQWTPEEDRALLSAPSCRAAAAGLDRSVAVCRYRPLEVRWRERQVRVDLVRGQLLVKFLGASDFGNLSVYQGWAAQTSSRLHGQVR
jgi:hypothetical protein